MLTDVLTWRDWCLHTRSMLQTPLAIPFMYVGSKEVYWNFKTCSIICVLFSTKCYLYHNLIFSCSNNTDIFNNHVLKFKYQPGHLKVKHHHRCVSWLYIICNVFCKIILLYFYEYDCQTQQFVKPDYRMSLYNFLWTTCFSHSYDHHQVRKS